jgi:hypothetical protein
MVKRELRIERLAFSDSHSRVSKPSLTTRELLKRDV